MLPRLLKYFLYPAVGAIIGLIYAIVCEQVYFLFFDTLQFLGFPVFVQNGWFGGLLIGALYAARK